MTKALGATISDLLPTDAPPDSLSMLREQARRQFDSLLRSADREFLLMLNPLLYRLSDSLTTGIKPMP